MPATGTGTSTLGGTATDATGDTLTRAQIEAFTTTHLETAATHWTETAQAWEGHFESIHNGMLRPGGTVWEGDAADKASDRSWGDLVKVRGAADGLHSASGFARNGAEDIAWAKRQVLAAIEEAEEAGFTVEQNLSVKDPTTTMLMRGWETRQQQAQAFATEIGSRAKALVAMDKAVAGKITAALAPVRALTFEETPAQDHGPTATAVDYHHFKQDPPPSDPAAPNPNFPGRDAQGRFTIGNSGSADGAAAAEARIKQAEKETGETFVRQQIRVAVIDPKTGLPMVDPRDGTPIYRYYDALQPTSNPNKYIGVEVKSGEADLTRRQRIFDDWVRSGHPATGTLNGKPVEIIDTEKLQAPRFVPPPVLEPAPAPRVPAPPEPAPAPSPAPRAPPPETGAEGGRGGPRLSGGAGAGSSGGGGGRVGGGGIVRPSPWMDLNPW
ncbi:hypothetical protein [Mycobacteroides abscessus]|uniref:hypothetical protein n=1 Tax=Mycobacteroides abscessus TaxID=36809 RepID=UPI0009A7DE3A|nr:hypothetical protein [Mycobacteroides abscessus]SKK20080.1 putative conserved membrane protein [Mycobacteroides abscessus subsp. abscessus]SKR42095.1 transmembrane protein [Mycobacteroides abscessus subsp. abscessus]